jgi:predicted Na+-dependent transporter
MKKIVDKYFAGILFLASLVGLIVPEPGQGVSYLILGLLFLIIFTSFFQFELKPGTLQENLAFSIFFSIIRFVAMPIAVFYLIGKFSDFWAFALAFLLFLPPGVSSPAIVSMLKGNFQLAISILFLGNILALFSIPLLIPGWYGLEGNVSASKLVFTLVFTILLPFFLHWPLRKKPKIQLLAKKSLPLVTVFCLSTIIILGVSKNRQYLLQDPVQVIYYFLLALGIYSLIFAMGWLFLPGRGRAEKAAAGLESGMNNIGLGVSLSIIYFAPPYTLFYLASQFAWIFLLMPLKFIVRKYLIKD